MRLISYNILDGGEGRADPLAETILAQKPDIIVLVEADSSAVVQRIADRAQMQYIQAAGRRHGTAVLSRWPIIESINHSQFHNELTDCVFEATVHAGEDQDWIIAAVHLHPRAYDKDDLIRQKEIDVILSIFAAHRRAGRPHLLAGDFNADTPVQQIDPARCKPATQKAWHANGNSLPRGAIEKLLAAGYLDSLDALRPSDAPRLGTFTTQFPGQRLDYIFTFGLQGRTKSAWIEQDRLAQFASDHYPVGLEVD